MADNELLKRFVLLLIIIAVIWFIVDNMGGLISVEKITLDNDVGTSGEFRQTKKTEIRPVKVELVSFNVSFKKDTALVSVKNVDKYGGSLTVGLSCVNPEDYHEASDYLDPGDIRLFTFENLRGECNSYVLYPDDITVTT